MAKNKVYVDVIVDDKGTTKKVALTAKQAAKAFGETGRAAQTADRNLKGAAQASANGTKNFAKMSQGISGGLVPAYATLAAQIFAVSAAFNFLKNAGNLSSLQKGQRAYAASTGVAMRTLTNDIIAATDAQVSFQDAAQAGAIGVAAGLSTQQITELGTAARDASVILGRDVTDSFNRLIRGVTKAEPELLDELGIILRLKDATNAYAESLNLNADDLTQFQKTQAVTADVLEQAQSKYSRIIDIVDPGVNKFNQLGKAFDDIVNNLKEFAASLAGPIADLLIDTPEIAYAGFLLIGRGVLTAAIPALSSLGEKMEEIAEKSSLAFEQSKKDIENYNRTLKLAQGDKGAIAALSKQGKVDAKAALKAAGVKSGRKGSGVEAILGGKELSARQLAATKKSAMQMQGIYKNMDDKIRRDFIRALDDMIIAQKAAGGKMVVEAETTGKKIALGYAKVKAGAQKLFAGVASFASKAGAAISGAFFWLQIATLAFSAGKIAYDYFFKSNEQMDEAITKQTMLTDRLKSLNEDYEKFAEIQKVMLEDAPNALQFFESFSNVVGSLTSGQLKLLVQQLREVSNTGFGALREAAAGALEASSKNIESIKQNTGVMFVPTGMAQALAGEQKRQAIAQKEVNLTLIEYVKNKEDATEAEIEAAKFLDIQIKSYKAMQKEIGETSKSGDEYFRLLNKLNQTGTISDEELAQLIKAKDGFLELGAAIKESKQLAEQNKQQIGDFIRGLSGQNNESRLLQGIANERMRIAKVAEETNKIDFERLKQLKLEETLIKTILDKKYQIALDTQKLEAKNIQELRGATAGQQARLKIDQQISANKLQERDIQLAINSTRQAAVAAGRKLDEQDLRSIAINEAKLEVIRQQNIDLERQKDIGVELEDTIKNSFESGFESGLADIIKGKVTSLKEAVATLATGMLEGIADVLAKRLTESVTDFLFPLADPAVKMKNAHVEGGLIAAEAIKAAYGGSATGETLEYIVPTGVRREQLPEKKGGYFDALFGTGRGDIAEQTGASGEGSEGVIINKAKGSLNNFLGSLGDIFNKNAEGGLVEKMGTAFEAGGVAFSDLFSGLKNMLGGFLNGLGGLLSRLFGGGGGTSTSSQIFGMFLSAAVSNAGGLFGGGASSAGSTTTNTNKFGYQPRDVNGLATTRYGGVVSEGRKMPGYAVGGIAKGPQSGYPVMMHGTEAVVPLPNNRSIPVDLKGAGQQNNVTVNVSVDGNGNAKQDTKSNERQGADLGNAIATAVQKELLNQKRSGGILSPYGG